MAKKDKNSPPTTGAKRLKFRLNRPDDVRRLLQRGINQVLADETSTDKLRAISYAAQTILKVFELTLIEERLSRIESALSKSA